MIKYADDWEGLKDTAEAMIEEYKNEYSDKHNFSNKWIRDEQGNYKNNFYKDGLISIELLKTNPLNSLTYEI